MKKKIILISALCIGILAFVIGLSYAYFSANVSYINQGKTTIKAAELELIYTGLKEVNAANVIPGDSFTNDFTVENKTGSSTNFNIYLENITNEFNEDLVYSIIDAEGNTIINERPLPKTTNGKAYLLKNMPIEDKEISNYTIKILYKYLEDVSQQENNGALFSGTVGIDIEALGHVVILDPDGGALSTDEVSVTEGEPYGSLPTPQKEGYTFVGWYTDKIDGEKIEEDSIFNLKNNQLLYARYTANKYVISYNANGGEVTPTSKEVEYDNVYGELPTPTLTGYTFKGWYLDSIYSKLVTEDSIAKITSDSMLYAKWGANTYTIALNADGGNVEQSTIEVTYNTAYGNLPTPTKEGYTFAGWYDSNNNEITSSSIYNKAKDETLTAHWNSNSYVVTLDPNGGNIDQNQKNVKYNQEYGEIDTPTREGYTFKGWFTEKTEGTQILNDSIYNVIGNQTIYAHWEANKYIITFDATGGNVDTASKEVTYDSTYGNLPTATYEGYTFVGWFDKETAGKLITQELKVEITENTTLYAVWSENDDTKYTVYHWQQNIDSEETSKDSTNYTLIDTQVLHGTTNQNVTPEVNTYEGFTSPAKQTVKIKNDGTAEVNYYYTRNNYKLTINKTEGVATTTGSGTYAYNKDVTVGYTIKEGYSYESITGDKSSATFKMPANDVTIQINTKANNYTVTFNPTSNCTIDLTSKEVTYDSTYGNLPTITCTGYRFDGWYTSESGQEEVTSTTKVTTASDHTLYAHITPNTYPVRFDANGGSEVTSTLTVTYDSTYGSLESTTKEGYEFKGWFTEKDGGSEVTSTTLVKITEEQTLYAHWNAKKYEVCFNANGGSEVSECKEVTYDAPYGELPTSQKEGYTFTGWYTLENEGSQVLEDTIVKITENQTLYARWSNNTYTVSFDANGGNVEIASKEVSYDTVYSTLPIPTKTGYVFEGWYTNQTSGSKITEITNVTIANNHTLYAHWKKGNYEISFDANGGSEVTSTLIVTYDEAYGNLPTPIREGYTFAGWYTDITAGDLITEETQVTTARNQILYAHWNANKYTVTFNAGDGEVTPSSKEVTYDATYGELPTATYEGYTFKGWYTDTEYNTRVTSETKVKITQGQILFAKYEANEYRVNLEANGGSVNLTYVIETYGNYYSNLPTPTKTGYEFAGWYTNETNGTLISSTTKVTTASEHTIYAHWNAITSTLTLNTSCGIIETTTGWNIASNSKTATKNVTYDATYGELPNVTSCTGYIFDGWYTASNGGTKITSGVKVTETSAHSLFAQFKPVTPTVRFDANGGNEITTTMNVTYDSTYGELPTPTRTGYVFEGWYTAKENGTKISNETKVTITEAQTLYAHWQVKKYTVTMSNTNATSSVSTLNINYGSSNTLTITPDAGYYISSVNCTNGYTTNALTGSQNYDTQTITISNNSNDKDSVCTVTANKVTAESITYTNEAYTSCTNVQCSIDELYEKMK